MQHFHDQTQLGEHRLWRADDDLQAVLGLLIGAVDFALRLLEADFAAAQSAARVLAMVVLAAFLEFLAGESEKPVIGSLARETTRGLFGVVARRQGPFGPRKVGGAAA